MEIEEIRDILRYIKWYYPKEKQTLDVINLNNEDSKLAAFYDMLVDTNIETDKEAALSLYGGLPDAKYSMLKSHFTFRALNTISFLDLQKESISDITRGAFKAYKNLFIISILLRLGSRNGAIALAKKTLRLSEKYELYHVSIQLLEHLRYHALLMSKKKNYEEYTKDLERNISLFESESKIRTLEQRLQIHSSASTFINEALAISAHMSLQEMEKELIDNDTYLNRIAYFRLQYMYYQYVGRTSESVAACENAISYMKTKLHLTPLIRIGEFKLRILENYTLSRNYTNGKKAAMDCVSFIPPDSSYWLQYKEQYFLLLMVSLKFTEARRVYDEVRAHARLRSQLSSLSERWEIYKLYLDYADDIIHREMPKSKPKRSYLLQQKKYQKTIKEYPTYSKDKRGLNVAILILNVLLLLENNKLDELIVQYEALSTYGYSHLRAKYSHQSSILFKMIRITVQNDFDVEKIKKKTARLEKKLALTKPSRYEMVEFIEILPPMWIWKRMKAALEARYKS